MRIFVAVALAGAPLAACGDRGADAPSAPAPASGERGAAGSTSAAPPVAAGEVERRDAADWRKVVSADDAAKLGRLNESWRLGRAEAEDKGFAQQVEALGGLVDPNAGLSGRLQPAPGNYRCRAIKLGTNGPGGPGYLESPFFGCTIELTPGGDLVLTRMTGPQPTRGLLYPDTDRRLIYIGAQASSPEATGVPRYGEQRLLDRVGVFERIGSGRWRLVLPWPRAESKLEILELVR